MLSSPIHSETFSQLSKAFVLHQDVLMARNIGSFIAILVPGSKLLFYDQNLVMCYEKSLNEDTEPAEEVLDFEFLDVSELCEISGDSKILLKVNTQFGFQVLYCIKVNYFTLI